MYMYMMKIIAGQMPNLTFLILEISIMMTIVSIVAVSQTGLAYAHFFGATKNIDNYQVIFSPSPSTPIADNSSTSLNFSVLENNTNIYNIYSALVVTAKQSGDIVGQIPYKFQEFSDISIPYNFNNAGDYVVTLQTRIAGDEKYQDSPLVASFDISVGNQLIPFDELMLFYVTPATAVVAGIAIYLRYKKKL
jgi:hypothetical protein